MSRRPRAFSSVTAASLALCGAATAVSAADAASRAAVSVTAQAEGPSRGLIAVTGPARVRCAVQVIDGAGRRRPFGVRISPRGGSAVTVGVRAARPGMRVRVVARCSIGGRVRVLRASFGIPRTSRTAPVATPSPVVVTPARPPAASAPASGTVGPATSSATEVPSSTPPPAPRTPVVYPSGVLLSGQTLLPGDKVLEPSTDMTLQITGDGQLAVMSGSRTVWTSGGGGPDAAAEMRADGELVLRSGASVTWRSGTTGFPGAALGLTPVGEVVLTQKGHDVWGTRRGFVGDRMEEGQRLYPGDNLRSPNGRHRFEMLASGNVVLSDGGSTVWTTNTSGANAEFVVSPGRNGTMSVIQGGATRWASGPAGFPGASLRLLDDGNLVLTGQGRTIWSIRTGYVGYMLGVNSHLGPGTHLVSPNGGYSAEMQGDGNFVVYRSGGAAQWDSGTVGHAGASVYMQSDGNLVIYAGPALWDSGTTGENPVLLMQDDGNLVVYIASGPTWSSQTGRIQGGGGGGGSRVDAFVSAYNGRAVDFDGVYGAQCVDLFNFYHRDTLGIGAIPWTPYAYQLWTRNDLGPINSNYDKVSPGAAAQKGDVAVYSSDLPGSYGAGHVAIVLADRGSTLDVFHQNWGGAYAHTQSISKGNLLGYLRPRR